MSDYFRALMWSAGTTPADVELRAVTSDPAAPTAQGYDLVEQHLEVEAEAPPERVLAHGESRDERAAGGLSATDGGEPAVTPARSAMRSADSTATREQTRATSLPAPLAQLKQQGTVHPAVRAALRWVAADPGPTSSPSPRLAAQEPASIDVDQPAARTPVRTIAVERTAKTAPSTTTDTAPRRAALRRAESANLSSSMREMDLSAPPQRTRQAMIAATDRPPAREQRVEVSIGTIHVTVDAPPPRVVAQPTPSTLRPVPERPAERSSFSRCRLPRM